MVGIRRTRSDKPEEQEFELSVWRNATPANRPGEAARREQFEQARAVKLPEVVPRRLLRPCIQWPVGPVSTADHGGKV